ncbi:MAG: PAC2 family protein [Acidilobaceae archaeon]
MTPVYEEEIEGFIFREFHEVGRPKYMIVGLPDVGLVGQIAAMHLVKSFQLKDKVGIDSYVLLPPVAVVREGENVCPIRVYGDDRLLVAITDIVLSSRAAIALSLALIEYARLKGVDTIVGFTGTATPDRAELEKPRVYWVSSNPSLDKMFENVENASKAREGFIVGPYAVMLKEALRKRLNYLLLMADSYLDIPDPEAAAEALRVFSKISGIEVPVDELVKEGELVRLKLREVMKEARPVIARMGKSYEHRLPIVY